MVRNFTTDEIVQRINRGEVTIKQVHAVRDLSPETLNSLSTFNIDSNHNVYFNKKKIGKIDDKQTIERLKNISQSTKLKSLKEIERELETKLN